MQCIGNYINKYNICKTTWNTKIELILCAFVQLKLIVLGGHIDSWDVGTGSMDDGGGVMIAWQVSELAYTLLNYSLSLLSITL